MALNFNNKTSGRTDIQHLESGLIAKIIIELTIIIINTTSLRTKEPFLFIILYQSSLEVL